MEIRFKGFGTIATLYFCPRLSPRGWITAWPGNHSDYKHGLVLRFFWLGFVVRWGHIDHAKIRRSLARKFYNAIAQANDGDYDVPFTDEIPF